MENERLNKHVSATSSAEPQASREPTRVNTSKQKRGRAPREAVTGPIRDSLESAVPLKKRKTAFSGEPGAPEFTKPYFGNRPAFHNPNVEIRAAARQIVRSDTVLEWHNHLHGVLPPQKYIDSLFLLTRKRKVSSLQAYEILANYYGNCDLAMLRRPMADFVTATFRNPRFPIHNSEEQKIRFVEHLLAARQQTPKFPYVHWDWAYDFRRTLRNQREKEIAKQETTRPPGNVLAALGPSMTAEQWCEAYRDIETKAHIDIGLAIESGMDVQEACDNAEKVLNYYRENSPVFSLTLSQSTADYFYLDKVAGELSLKKNNVKISHLDGKHNLPSSLVENIEKRRMISLNFLYGFHTKQLAATAKNDPNIQVISSKKLNEMKVLLCSSPEYVGTDFRAPESDFHRLAVRNAFGDLYAKLVEVADHRLENGEGTTPLVIRVHVGESNMDAGYHDPEHALQATKNIEVILKAIESVMEKTELAKMKSAEDVQARVARENPVFKRAPRKSEVVQAREELAELGQVATTGVSRENFRAYDSTKVVFRLGHVTHITLAQAAKVRELGLDVEINSLSNLTTFGAKDAGSLPVVKFYVVDMVNIYRNKTSRVPPMTSNTDGNGVMSASIQEDYAMSMTSVAAFRKKTRNVDNSVSSIQVSEKDLKFITGDQSEKKILKNQALVRMKAALNGASKTDFVYTDIRREVRKKFFLAGPYMKDAHRSALQKEKTKPGRGDKR